MRLIKSRGCHAVRYREQRMLCRYDAVIHFAGRKAVGESVKEPWLYYTCASSPLRNSEIFQPEVFWRRRAGESSQREKLALREMLQQIGEVSVDMILLQAQPGGVHQSDGGHEEAQCQDGICFPLPPHPPPPTSPPSFLLHLKRPAAALFKGIWKQRSTSISRGQGHKRT